MIKLGSKVKDSISGFSGIATGRSTYLHGCVHICITPQELHEAKLIGSQWFDEPQVMELVPDATSVAASDAQPTGGPQDHPSPRTHSR